MHFLCLFVITKNGHFAIVTDDILFICFSVLSVYMASETYSLNCHHKFCVCSFNRHAASMYLVISEFCRGKLILLSLRSEAIWNVAQKTWFGWLWKTSYIFFFLLHRWWLSICTVIWDTRIRKLGSNLGIHYGVCKCKRHKTTAIKVCFWF